MSRPRQPIAHGTYGGYQVHRRRGEDPCYECMKGAADYQKAYRQRATARRRNSAGASARSRALTHLSHLHPDEYQALYARYLGEIRSES